MTIPLFSIISLYGEVGVTMAVLYVIWQGFVYNTFRRRLAYGVLMYETLFNISYMVSREVSSPDASTIYNPYTTSLAIFHGVFSLLMFVLLVVFFLSAAQHYARGTNFFRDHRRTTLAFVIAWLTSVASGFAFFVVLYVS